MQRSLLFLASAVVLAATPALAQNSNGSSGPVGAPPKAAQKCLADLGSFASKMRSEGYWVTGWGTRWGYGVPVAGPAPLPPAAASGTSGSSSSTGQTQGATTAPSAGPVVAPPWGVAYGTLTPRYQIRALYRSADVLGHLGDEGTCQAVLKKLRQVAGNYTSELRQAGVKPSQVTSWRQVQLVAAKPVTQLGNRMLSFDDLTGTDVRNARDQLLGTVDDVVLDPKNGSILYLILARGGFLGIGTDFVAVPWTQMKATPSMNTLVLDVPEQTVADAPAVNPDQFANPGNFDQRRQRLDQYWGRHQAG
jgi:sporulation protein YlmC with PRC-barrel domain